MEERLERFMSNIVELKKEFDSIVEEMSNKANDLSVDVPLDSTTFDKQIDRIAKMVCQEYGYKIAQLKGTEQTTGITTARVMVLHISVLMGIDKWRVAAYLKKSLASTRVWSGKYNNLYIEDQMFQEISKRIYKKVRI